MRVIAGKYKGRTLFYGDKKQHRPTQDRVKESLFNMIQAICLEARVLDAFSGTGSLGIEALSRGASHVVFVDKTLQYLERNLSWIDDEDQIEIKKTSILTYLKKTTEKFDIIFLDPPWNQLYFFEDALKLIFDFDILSDSGVIICEHPKTFKIDSNCGSKKIKKIGSTSLTLIQT